MKVKSRPHKVNAVYLASQRFLRVGDTVKVYWGGIAASGSRRTRLGEVIAIKSDGQFTLDCGGEKKTHSRLEKIVAINGCLATLADKVRWGQEIPS